MVILGLCQKRRGLLAANSSCNITRKYCYETETDKRCNNKNELLAYFLFFFALMCKSEAFRMLELTNNFVFFVTSFKKYLVLVLVCLFLSISPIYIQELGKTWEDIQNEIEEEEETRTDGNADEE